MLDNEKKNENNQEYKRGSVGIITAKTVKGNLKLIGFSAVALVVIFCIAAFVEASGTVYDMMIGAAAFSGLSIIFSVCKIISITAKSKVKFIADLEEKKAQKNEQMEKEAKVKAVEAAAAETAKQPLTETASQPNGQKQFDSKLVVIIVLAVLLVAAVTYILFDKGVVGINKPPQSKSEIIYIYGDSHYYHKESCYYHDNIPISKMMREDEAIKQGYSPCPLCKG